MWTPKVKCVSVGLEESGYAHVVRHDDGREITVTHHTHRNYDHIHEQGLGCGHVRYTGVGPRKPDLTPHPDAVKIADALNS